MLQNLSCFFTPIIVVCLAVGWLVFLTTALLYCGISIYPEVVALILRRTPCCTQSMSGVRHPTNIIMDTSHNSQGCAVVVLQKSISGESISLVPRLLSNSNFCCLLLTTFVMPWSCSDFNHADSASVASAAAAAANASSHLRVSVLFASISSYSSQKVTTSQIWWDGSNSLAAA